MDQIMYRGLSIPNKNIKGDRPRFIYGEPHLDCKYPHIHDLSGKPGRNIYPHTVGQYSGVDDRYGVKTYEGDFVRYYTLEYSWIPETSILIKECLDEVIFRNGMFCLTKAHIPIYQLTMPGKVKLYHEDTWNDINNKLQYKDAVRGVNDLDLFEVISNRFENPRLLGKIYPEIDELSEIDDKLDLLEM